MLINILGNAVKFTPEGGTVSFTIEDVKRLNNQATLRFTVRDTGIGMSKGFLPRIFDAFSQEDSSSTSKFGSTGLGMPITKSIVELMNGRIDVENEKGVGTTFTVTVTLTQANHETGKADEFELHPHEMSVLVIDDDRVACDHAQLVLSYMGITCETVLSGEEAVELVRIRHTRRDDFNLILVDWKMPGMDGVETTRTIRATDRADAKTIPIIALTANAFDEDVQRSMQAGLNAHLSKPVEPDLLFETLEELLAE